VPDEYEGRADRFDDAPPRDTRPAMRGSATHGSDASATGRAAGATSRAGSGVRVDPPAGDVVNEQQPERMVRRSGAFVAPTVDAPPHIDGNPGRRVSRGRPPIDAGPLVLIGGACTPAGEALARFIDLAGAREAGGIIGLTTASADPERSAALWRDDFRVAGARTVDLPIVKTRIDADDAALADRIRATQGIFLGGGDQVKLVSMLSGTKVGCAIREAWMAGATVCGTSAGAAALTELTLAGGEIDEEGSLVEMYIGPGLGLLGYRALIDTHFGARRRLHRLVVAIANNPELLGLGVDEDTALVVHGHTAEVVGAGGVTFVDGRSMRLDDAAAAGLGKHRTFSHLRVGAIGPGHAFDLRERELATLVRAGVEVGA
jgi:cyanophycinase